MSAAALRLREREYSCLSHYYHVVLGVNEVCRLTYTVSEALCARGLIISFLFPGLALHIGSSDARIASFKHSSVLGIAP